MKETDCVKDKIIACGGNTGNLIWENAVANNIVYDEIKGSVHNYVIPMANCINAFDNALEKYTECFEREKNYRVTIFGIGAQLTEELTTPKKLLSALPRERVYALKELTHYRAFGECWCTR